MNTNTLSRALSNIDCFHGIFPRDKLPNHPPSLPSAIVINLDKSDQPGSHWVTLFIDHEGRGEYFDPFGIYPQYVEIINYFDRNCGPMNWAFSPVTLQNIMSMTCGLYCILFVRMRCQGYSYCEIISHFSRDTIENDRYIYQLAHSAP